MPINSATDAGYALPIPRCSCCGSMELNCCDGMGGQDLDNEPNDRCTNPLGHEWSYSGTQYGGDDERYGGEGTVHCMWCGADGDA